MATSPKQVADPAFDPWSRTRRARTTRAFSVPLVVAVTGHRDLVPKEMPLIRERVRQLLRELRDSYPDRAVMVMSALAEGADRLVAQEALDLGLPLTALLPMDRDLYAQDFKTPQSRAEFERFLAAAVDVFELPLAPGNTPASIGEQGLNRARQYAAAGVFMCAHCHVLLALWDGKPSDQLGGTSQVVRFHHDDIMPGYTPRATASRLSLTNDESDLVYHIVCSRDRADGAPAPGFEPLQVSWFTADEGQPRSHEIPRRHRMVFERANEFSRDVQQHAEEIESGKYPLLTEAQAAVMPPGLQDINQVFCAADWLAIHFQQRFMRTLRITHVCALLTGMAFVAYSDLLGDPLLLFGILGSMVVAYVVSTLATRGSWHRKYLDYRTLAEGLRVQFYWAAAGVTTGNVSKFAHDNFLQMQDPELGWIRNVMRVAGTECDVAPNLDPGGVQFAVSEWIGDDKSGQLGYYGRKIKERVARQETTHRVMRLGLWATAVAFTSLLVFDSWISGTVQNEVTFLLGCILLLVGVRQSYAKNTAESELIKQFEFMNRIFRNARRCHDAADSDDDRRRILKILGDAALEEHAEWILMYRERAIEAAEAVKLG